MIFWEEDALKDRQYFFKYLYQFDPKVAHRCDEVIEKNISLLNEHPHLGVKKPGLPGRFLIIPAYDISIFYIIQSMAQKTNQDSVKHSIVNNVDILVLRILHQKQQFPPPNPESL
uniref:type II toxin-antitoxin system RelE/ParE family toxin n=1 Tax=Ningiella ruwaisensis TaxID=2364274 RepID=UPI00109F4313|nr:type II toxin-antitoxin system RelE/ParE family toxin [Ningiella ruwaisensis]